MRHGTRVLIRRSWKSRFERTSSYAEAHCGRSVSLERCWERTNAGKYREINFLLTAEWAGAAG